jgi:BirA family transcriptional regulator, biotin operon repressor / biotin---[acetyl-CoA-carboxylase] ligase
VQYPSFFNAVHELDTVDSTNSYISRLLQQADIDVEFPFLVIAHEQTAGRGRGAKKWLSDEGSLTFSIAWRPESDSDFDYSMLPLCIGIAVADGLKHFVDVRPQVKWPNDVMLDGKKVCGILMECQRGGESSTATYIIGIGINCEVNLDSIDESVAARATCVADYRNDSLDDLSISLKQQILFEVLYEISLVLTKPTLSIVSLADRWNRYCFLRGKEIRVRTSCQLIDGRCAGIDNQGALVVCDQKGNSQAIISGDVSW